MQSVPSLTRGNKGAANSTAPKQTVKQIVTFYLSLTLRGYTRRDLSKATGIEIATLCAALKALENAKVIEVGYTTTCNHTGREVAVYTIKRGYDACVL